MTAQSASHTGRASTPERAPALWSPNGAARSSTVDPVLSASDSGSSMAGKTEEPQRGARPGLGPDGSAAVSHTACSVRRRFAPPSGGTVHFRRLEFIPFR